MLIIIFVLTCIWLRFLLKSRARLPLPPGPKKYPLIGSLFSMPQREAFRTFTEWSKTYGSDIIHLDIAGYSMLIINSYDIAKELVDHRSKQYSSRPPFVMINKLLKLEWDFGLMPYGDRWRTHRRLCDRELRASAVTRFQSTQLKYCHRILQQFMENPTPVNVMTHLRYLAGGTMLSIAYGLDVKDLSNSELAVVEKGNVAIISGSLLPISFFFDVFPFLQHLPRRLLGSQLGEKVLVWKKAVTDMLEVPFAAANLAIEQGISFPSILSYSMQEPDYDEEHVKSVLGTMYSAAADSTISTLGFFILHMLNHPDIQKRGQKELDVKLDLRTRRRLPTLDDRSSLPFITAIVNECLRWMPVAPLGFPHFTEVDDVYNGYMIPANTSVMCNLWAMANDETIYSDPLIFKPDRFMKGDELNSDVMSPENIVFGFGRRICPGRWLALNSIWITIASILAVFEIRPPVDNTGKFVKPTYNYGAELTVTPKPFTCQFAPRFSDVKEVIDQSLL